MRLLRPAPAARRARSSVCSAEGPESFSKVAAFTRTTTGGTRGRATRARRAEAMMATAPPRRPRCRPLRSLRQFLRKNSVRFSAPTTKGSPMVSRKIERAKHGPSVLEVFLGAALSLVLGVAAALVYLIVQPVQIGLPDSKAEPMGPVTYVKGTQDEDHGKQWLRKKQLFTEGTSVDLNEDELNAWITAGTEPEPPKAADTKPPAPGKPAEPAAASKLIQFGTQNFRIANKMLQIGTEGEIDLDMVGIKRSL